MTAVTSSVTEWSGWLGVWSALAEVHESLGREAVAEGRSRSAGGHLQPGCRLLPLRQVLLDPRYPGDAPGSCPCCELLHGCVATPRPTRAQDRDPPGQRPDGRCPAPRAAGPHPVVILVPGLDSAKEELRPTEQLFLDRGLATFVVDGPGQGEAEYDLPIRPDWEVPGAAIIDALEELPEVDATPHRGLGCEPGRVLRSTDGDGRAPGAGCHIPLGAVPVRDQLGRPAQPDPGCLPGPVVSETDGEAHAKALELSLAGRAGNIVVPMLIVAGHPRTGSSPRTTPSCSPRRRVVPWNS